MKTKSIEQWLAGFAQSDDSLLRDDVHVERIDEMLRDREHWVGGALAILREARQIRAARSWRFTVAIEFFLTAHIPAAGMSIMTADDLGRQLSWTPPALTVYKKGHEPWRESSHFRDVTPQIDATVSSEGRVLFQEWFDEGEGNFDRRLWVVSEFELS